MADEKQTTLENVVDQNVNERQMQINKILASKSFILIGNDGITLVENIPAHDVLPLLAHAYSYKLPHLIESMVVATIQHTAKELEKNELAKTATESTKKEG